MIMREGYSPEAAMESERMNALESEKKKYDGYLADLDISEDELRG